MAFRIGITFGEGMTEDIITTLSKFSPPPADKG